MVILHYLFDWETLTHTFAAKADAMAAAKRARDNYQQGRFKFINISDTKTGEVLVNDVAFEAGAEAAKS